MRYDTFYHQMPDGTIKQINPFSGTEVWAVPGRGNKPISNAIPETAEPIVRHTPEDYCDFCEAHYLKTPPEKSRLVLDGAGHPVKLDHVPASRAFETTAEFRRVGNLFEIVTLDYWRDNYDYRMSPKNQAWRDAYLADEVGLEHVIRMINFKLNLSGRTPKEIVAMPTGDKLSMAEAFFGGGHELILAKTHFTDGATYDSELKSSGEMTPAEHYLYYRFTIDAMEDIFRNNRYIRYISTFQNWLRPAGASLNHLHKQLVGLDSWSVAIENQMKMVRDNANVFNEYGPNFAAHHNLIFAENEHAIAYAGIGHRYPALAIYSKSRAGRPYEVSEAELRSFSDLVHACHAAMGNTISCNEEWYYTPRDAVYRMPWRVLIKWRVNTPAGFEGNTSIFINPVSPMDLRDKVVPRLYELRDAGRLAPGIQIAEECACEMNPLQYYR